MPDIRWVSLEELKAERDRKRGHRGQRARWPQEAGPGGRMVDVPYRRLITTSDGITTVVNKVVIDVNQGREDVPLLYGDIYDNLSSDTLPRNVDTNLLVEGEVVFLQRVEGGEVRFGTLSKGTPATVPIVNYSAAFEWTREAEMFDETWRIERFNLAYGRAYNALLNHLHLSPILTYTYTAANQTPADATAGADLLTRTRNTILAALRTAADAGRPGSVLLIAGANRYQIADALARRYDNVGNQLPAVDEITTIVIYNGYTITVGEKTYVYTGVTTGRAYLIRPRRKFMELVRTEGGRDMIVLTDNQPDISRGIAAQMVAHTYRGSFADIPASVEEITLPV